MQAQTEIALERLTASPGAQVPEPLAQLTGVNLDDLTTSVGWQGRSRLAAMLRWVFHAPAEKFARQMLDFDGAIGNGDLPLAARQSLRNYVRDVRVFGRRNLPARGPVIVLANHPGMSDTLALFAAIDRPDMRVIAVDRPFLRALPNTSAHLYYVSEDSGHRISAVKKTSTHLRAGGAVLTFPAGEIEPDPAVYHGAVESLSHWTDSAGVFLRFAPQAVIVPALVRHVIWKRTANAPPLRIKKNRADRERLAAALQLLSHLLLHTQPVTPTIQFGAPVGLAEVGSSALEAIHAVVMERMRGLLVEPPQGAGESVM